MAAYYIGCSGFHYKHWKTIFYPDGLPQKKWFSYYCRYFNTLELNVTFYRFPQVAFLENWYTISPEDFRFSVKVPRAITHYKKFVGTAGMIADFYDTLQKGLKEKLGAVLFQLPPMIKYSDAKLNQIIDSLDGSFSNVIEFRHESWWRQEVYDALAAKNIAFCGMSHPALPREIVVNASHAYYRLHGTGQLYASEYSEQELQQTAETIRGYDHVKELYVYFNNDIHGYAVKDAQQLMGMLG